MIVIDNREEKTGSQQHKAEIFDCFAYLRSAKSHFYAKPCNFKDSTPIEENFGILEHDGFILRQLVMKFCNNI